MNAVQYAAAAVREIAAEDQRQGTNFSSFCSVIAIAVASTQHAAKSAVEGTGLSDNAR
jgi:hypothetical protein